MSERMIERKCRKIGAEINGILDALQGNFYLFRWFSRTYRLGWQRGIIVKKKLAFSYVRQPLSEEDFYLYAQ